MIARNRSNKYLTHTRTLANPSTFPRIENVVSRVDKGCPFFEAFGRMPERLHIGGGNSECEHGLDQESECCADCSVEFLLRDLVSSKCVVTTCWCDGSSQFCIEEMVAERKHTSDQKGTDHRCGCNPVKLLLRLHSGVTKPEKQLSRWQSRRGKG
jgi:hypothetical protein